MRIAYIIDTLYPFELGGAQKRVWEIGRRLAKDHDVHVFGMKYWQDGNVHEQDGMTYHGVCNRRELYSNGRRTLVQPLEFSAKLLKPIWEEDFDVIDCQKSSYFHFFPTKVKCYISDIPLVGTFNEVWGDYWYNHIGWKGIFGKCVEHATLNLPDKIITISEMNRKKLATFGRSHNDISVIPDGIGFEEIDAAPEDCNSFDVLYAGRLIGHKNVDLLLEAVARLVKKGKSVNCGIIGEGPEMDKLRNRARDLGIGNSVEFLGFIEDIKDVYCYMKNAGVFVLPSSREGAGLVTLEANACGTPSVTTRHENNAATEVVENGVNGYIADLTVEDLSETISQALMESPNLIHNCRQYSRQFEWDNLAADTAQVYESF